MRPRTRILASPIATLLACFVAQPFINAQTTYVWSVTGGGSWGTAASWSPAGPAAGAGNIADISTRNITANATITLDGNRTIGTVRFGDATTGSHNWTLNTGSSGTLTLDATSGPGIIEVVNQTATIGAVLAGNDGFQKNGVGTLRLNGANTWTGAITVTAGNLQLGNNAAISTLSNTIDVNNTGTSSGGNGTMLSILDNFTLGAAKTVNLNSGPSNNRVMLFGQNNAVHQGSTVISGASITQLSSGAGTFTITGNITGTSGAFLVRGAGTGVIAGNIDIGNSFVKTDGGTWRLNTTGHTWVGQTQISDGTLQLGINDALVSNLPVVLGQGSATNGRFDLNGFNQTIDAALRTEPSSTGTAHVIRNSNLTTASTFSFTTATGTTDIVRNVQLFGAPQAVGNLNLVKNGSGRLEFQGGRIDNSSIDVNDGTFAFTGGDDRVALAAISGAATGIVEKTGAGVLDVAGNYTHAGSTLITAGRMSFSSGSAGAVSVSPAAVLGGGYNAGRLSADSISFAAGSGFIGRLGGAATPLVSAANLTVNDVTEINIEAANLTPGIYKLIGYGGGAIGGNGFAGLSMGAPGSSPHMTAVLEDSGTSIDLNVTAVDSLVWTGAISGAWDRNITTNFKLASDASPANFYQSDAVHFDDSALVKGITGSGSLTVGNLTFNNSAGNDYTITAALSGPGGLTKAGTGTVTLSNTTATAPLGLSGPITVAGGTLNLNSPNASHGDVTIDGATLRMGHADAIASGALVTVSNGGTLDVNGQAPNLRIPELRVSGAGVGGAGAVVNNGAGITNNSSFAKVVVEGDVSWGGSARNDFSATTRLEGNGFTLTKVGTGETWFQPVVQSPFSAVIVNGGVFGVQVNNPLGSVPVTVNSGGTHSIFGAVTASHPIFLNDGSVLRSTSSTPTAAGLVTLNGTTAGRNIQAINNTTLNVSGKVTGTGGFTLADAGIVVFQNADNDYAGDTIIAGTTGANTTGTLRFNPTGNLPATTNLFVNSGMLDTSNRTITVGSVSGSGGIIGQATAGTGVLATTQSSSTTFSGNFNRALLRMNGTGTVTLAGTTDNSTGTVEANSGTVVFAKTGDYAAHSIGAAGLGLTVNDGATVQLAGNLTAFTGGTGNNTPPSDITVATPPSNYVDQIFNLTDVALNTGGTLDLNGRIEAIDALTGAGTVTNTAGTAARLYVGYGNTAANFAGVIENGSGGATTELSKLGTGPLVLTGNSTYTGPTTVFGGLFQVDGELGNTTVSLNAGTLQGGGTIGGTVVAATATTINVGLNTNGVSAATLTVGGLNLGTGTRALNFDHTGTAADKIAVTGTDTLILNGTNNVNVLLGADGWVSGTYPLITYAGSVGGGGAGTLALQTPIGHNTVTIANDGVGAINLQVTATPAKWLGSAGPTWDVNTTANFNTVDGVFLNGDTVIFDDATATNFAPTIAAPVTPSSVIFDTGTAFSLSGTSGIAGSGNLTKTGTGTLTISNPNTFTGRTNVQNGVLTVNYTSATPLAAASLVDVAAPATVNLVHTGGVFTVANSFSGSGTIVIDPSTTTAGNRDLPVTGNLSAFTGTLRLAPTNGTMRIQVDNAADLGGTVDVRAGGQVFFSANNVTVENDFTLAGTGWAETAGTLGAIRAANPTTFTGNITIDGSAKIGAYAGTAIMQGPISGGALTFGGNNNASITETLQLLSDASTLTSLTVNGGSSSAGSIVLELGDGVASGNLGTVPLTLRSDSKGAVLRIRQGNDYVLNSPVTTIGAVTLQLDTVAGTTNGTGVTLPKGINLNNGTIQVGTVAIANGAVAKATINLPVGEALSGGSFFLGDQNQKQGLVDHLSGDVVLAGRLQVGHFPNETSTYNLSGGSVNLTAAAPATFPYATGVGEQLGGVYLGVDGTGVLTQTGGTLTTNFIVLDNRGNTGAGLNQATGVDTYTLNSGTLVLKSSYGIISRNATTAVNLEGGTIQADTDTSLDSDKITVSVLTTLNTNGKTITAFGGLSGAGALKVSGGGTFRTADSAAIGGGSLGTVSAQIDAGATLLADRTGSDTWTGGLDGPGTFRKGNTGSLVLTGNSPGLTGPTEVNGGALVVDGGIPNSPVAVNSGGTLMGNGVVGSLTVNAGGSLEVGGSAGLLDAGTTVFNGGTFAVELNGTAVEAEYDQLRVTGTVAFSANTPLTLSLGFTPSVGQSFTIVNNDLLDLVDLSGGLFTFDGTPLPDNAQFGALLLGEGEAFRIDYDGGIAGGGNDVVLTVVPEPGSAALLLAGIGSLIGLRRSRRRASVRN